MKTLHVHLDESGNFDFTPTGTKHFVFAVAWTYDPLPLAHDLTALRFKLLKQGTISTASMPQRIASPSETT